ncbi:MAG: acyltransferase, partial [Planctomycetes bacterium]|nr:acyltransferase [Planctomycetota bacterium]
MKVGFLQTFPRFGKKNENIDRAISSISGLNADLIVLPELFNTGYQFTSVEEALALSEKIPNGQTMQELIKMAKEKKLYIVTGLAERENER